MAVGTLQANITSQLASIKTSSDSCKDSHVLELEHEKRKRPAVNLLLQ